MPGAGERSYAFAKACGIIGKSFVGRRIKDLYPIRSLSEFDRLVFGAAARELPERELLSDLERRLCRRSVAAIAAILESYRKPPELLTLLVRVYEYADLKIALALIAEKETASKPVVTGLGRFAHVRFDAWPDAKAMLEGTDLEFILSYLDKNKDKKGTDSAGSTTEDNESGEVSMETALDRHYYTRLWTSLSKLNKKDRKTAEKIIAEEIALRNCSWALRLRSYYGMKPEETAAHLVVVKKNPRLCEDALHALEFSLDDRSDWEQWKRFRFLNPDSFSGRWKADPRYFQNAAAEYLYRLALRGFRNSVSFIDKVFCFIKLKQFEEDLLTSNIEGLGMGLASKDVFTMLETVP